MANNHKKLEHKVEGQTPDDLPWYPRSSWYLRVPKLMLPVYSSKLKDDTEPTPIPEMSAGFFSLLTFSWMSPLLGLGYARPLQISDLYKLQDHRSSSAISTTILESFDRRRKVAEEYNDRLLKGVISPAWRSFWWTLRGDRDMREDCWRTTTGRKQASLILSMNDSVKWWFWSAGALRVSGDILIIASPLVVQAIINFGSDSLSSRIEGRASPSLGKGIALALGLLAMQITTSLCVHQYWYRAMSTGILLRGGLIAAIYSRSFHLSPPARAKLSDGQLVTHIATDVSRIDNSAQLAHMAWSAVIQIFISLGILIFNLGPSALAGFALLLAGTPFQAWILKLAYSARTDVMRFTDSRVKLTQELLSGIRVIKFFSWERPFLAKLNGIRAKELKYLRKLLLINVGNNAVAASLPVLATVVAFVCYSLTGHSLTPGVIFSSLTLFQLLRTPITLLPIALNSITDAYNATSRLYTVFAAEVAHDDRLIDHSSEAAISIEGASFTWEVAHSSQNNQFFKKKSTIQTSREQPTKEEAFEMHDINLSIPFGQLVLIVGPVGSGKSSLIQGLVGNMRKTEGKLKIGGSISYCPQSPWIQNSTVRDNICFGKSFNEKRYEDSVRLSCLEQDLALLPDGDMTEIGEKGVSLSGGQKQRLSICRAIYADTEIQIFDDPLSALDTHVGKDIFHNILKSQGQNTTRILVTNALQFLPLADYIITMDKGHIIEQGTYAELVSNETGAFSKLVEDLESKQEPGQAEAKEKQTTDDTHRDSEDGSENATVNIQSKNPVAALMQEEERSIGAVSGDVYRFYFTAGKAKILFPLILASLLLTQAITMMTSYWLIYWQERKWPQPQGFYIGIYAGLGSLQAVMTFGLGALFAAQAYFASREIHRAAIVRVIHSPISFFETTPLGRLMNRFSKDIDSADNYLGNAWSSTCTSIGSVVGTIVLISAIFPWFVIPIFLIFVFYYLYALIYRQTARELNRLNSILRSTLVSHFSESLAGMSTIRAYGQFERFRTEHEKHIDNGNRAYWLSVAAERWLAIRLDAFGQILIFAVALISVVARNTITPSQSGIMLSYILTIQPAMSMAIRQAAKIETMMNSVERMEHYAKHIEQEKFHGEPSLQPPTTHKDPNTWPVEGSIDFQDLCLSYRPDLPIVLKGISMRLAPGEKLGIVGRTGAGKSSIMVALYRLVEASAGSISIDGYDISKLDLETLRQAITIIPQESTLFSGTVRSNLDPFGQYEDALLWDALRRSHLKTRYYHEKVQDQDDHEKFDETVNDTQTAAPMKPRRFALDEIIEEGGGNLSMGERSLVSLARALVKKSRILVLDEATASVDYETDKKIQDLISREFRQQTILCIAHRLQTIIGYDRVCVMEAGCVAQLDTPAELFRQPGIFKKMCEQSGISIEDILHANTRASKDSNGQ